MTRGLTQAQLAVNSGVAQPNISAIEHDRRVPSIETMHRLIAGCGFELLAVAGPRVVAFPAPGEPEVDDRTVATVPVLSEVERAHQVAAALDVAELIVRRR